MGGGDVCDSWVVTSPLKGEGKKRRTSPPTPLLKREGRDESIDTSSRA